MTKAGRFFSFALSLSKGWGVWAVARQAHHERVFWLVLRQAQHERPLCLPRMVFPYSHAVKGIRHNTRLMLLQPHIDPVLLHIWGPFAIRWYGLSYLAAFALFWFLGMRRLAHPPFVRLKNAQGQPRWTRQSLEDLLFWGVAGVVLGGRLGYCLFYKPDFYLANPALILQAWDGGMSFHGGLLGVTAAMALWAWRHGLGFLETMDFVAPCIPTGLACGRIGNFINGELWGRAADPSLPWAMVFRDPAAGGIARHPSQIYQFLLEGLLLFALLWVFARKERKPGEVGAAFLLGYGLMRFVAEYFREPDAYLEWLAQSTGLSMGQWLCVPMMVLGAGLWAYFHQRGKTYPA